MFNKLIKYSLTVLSILTLIFSSVMSISSNAQSQTIDSNKSNSPKQDTSSYAQEYEAKNQKKFKLDKIIQPESDLVEKLIDSKTKKVKKNLKKPIGLEFTSTNIEKDMSKKQKEAILLTLKKWKLQMPYDNKFTITGMLPAGDSFVVYMMSSVPNPNFDPNKEYNSEDFETNDLRFIDTPFNVLLKNKKNNNWKAILAQDSSETNEIISLSEKDLDNTSKDKLFGIKKPDSKFTEIEDVIVENSNFSSSSSLTNINSLISSSSLLNSSPSNSSSSIFSSISSIVFGTSSSQSSVSTFTSSSFSSTSKTVGFLDILFGTPKVSAGESDYSWPWKAGETWNVNSGSQYSPRSNYKSNRWHSKVEEADTTNRGLDIMVPNNYWNSTNGNWNDIPVLAPKSGTITQVCTKNGTGGDNYFMRIDDMYIWHMTPSNNFIVNATVKKGDQIGTVAIGSNRSGNVGQGGGSDYSGKCGMGTGAHLHVKFMLNNMVVDNSTLTWESDTYSSFTSQNTTITDPNITNVIPTQDAWWKALDEGCKTDSGSRVYIWDRNDGNCQKMRYNSGNKTITNPWGKCIDAGNVNNSSDRWVRFSNCNNGINQQWLQEGEGGAGKGRIWSQEKTTTGEIMCMEYVGLNNGDEIKMSPCSSNNANQKFYYDLGITGQNVPTTNSTITDPNINTILPPQADWKKALDFGCKTAENSRVYIWDRGAGGNYWASNDCQKMRYNSGNNTITNPYGKCMDSGDSNSNRWIRFSSCTNSNNQKWLQESQSKGGRIWSFQKNSNNQVMCIEHYSLDNSTGLDVNPCNSNQTQKWYSDMNITNGDVPNSINYKMMRSYYNGSYGMNIYGGGSNNQAQVKMYGLSGTDNELMTNNSNYELVFKNGKCLDGGDVNNSNNRWLRIDTCHGGNNQKWFFDSYNRLVNYANQSLCVDSAYGDSNGSLLYLYPCHNGNNQKWSLN